MNVQTTSAINQLIQWGKYKEAIEEIEKYIQNDPEESLGYALMAKVYTQKDDYDKAIYWVEEALKKDPEDALAWELQVSIAYTQEKWREFNRLVDDAFRIFPTESHFYYLKANELSSRMKFKEAMEQMEQALRISPKYALYLANYSYLLAHLNEKEGSLQYEKRALQEEVEDSSVFMYLAWSADRRGDHKIALSYFENAIRLNPNNNQVRDEYLESLQKQYFFYRMLIYPSKMFAKNRYLFLVLWLVAAFLFRPLILLFIVLYIASHWLTKLLVHVKIFGWSFSQR
ncbi:tetratricopeptide repeat protein [Chengkuizengella axinellae]|uniref:Tetratricopeptide repeat protein n=1 Tax=Chengkuizengella axinellae TaxID=3064388 RepID=A0ABT9J183_9BACL|nr:tetratricopeptide repeat protein [Chengkuizengella sp. 2205SS18-9]MDP5275376.1 tetratricopeptide repeat protein [Chengkuizengella sp. 2205SS18-9]